MFDKLIESNSEAAEFKDRRSYFMASSIVVGVLFLAAVVVSIYAGEIGLGHDDFELTALISPATLEATADPQKPEMQAASRESNYLPVRQANIQRASDSPVTAPAISVNPNTKMSRPAGDFMIDASAVETNGSLTGTGRKGSADGIPAGQGLANETPVAEKPSIPEPPPPVDRKFKPTVIRSIGVVNGIAKSLPKPPYPPTALSMNIEGKVDVQVTIDETGNVIACKAVSGHPFLKAAAEIAARQARFTPTLLSNVPIKVTGVIVYNFSRK
jgi:TonB family protein